MSAHSVPESFSKTQARASQEEEEKGSEIPPEVLQKAQQDIHEFFKNDLPDASPESMQWVMERVAPAMASVAMREETVDPLEVEGFLDRLKGEVGERIEALNGMNFSRGHELAQKTYPSVGEMDSLVSWIKSLSKSYSLYKKVPEFKVRFAELFIPFVNELLLRVKNQALLSRHAQLEALMLRCDEMDKSDYLGEISLIESHIEALNAKPAQPLLELRDLLNLSQLPWLERQPTMTEQKAYRFLAEFV